MKKNVNWGILAPGHIAEKFASDLKFVENATLYAIGSRSIERSKAFADRFDALKYYGSYMDLVRDQEVDVIYIASPHPFHCEHTKLCLNHGKHVLCEKPMGMNAQEVTEVSELAKKKGLFLMEAFWTRFHPSFSFALEQISDGTIGNIHSIYADFGFTVPEEKKDGRLLNKELGGGALLDIGLYPVFLALSILGKPDEIVANGIIGPTGVDINNHMLFRYDSKNCFANLTSTFQATLPTEAVIAGSKGYIRLNRSWHCPTSVEIIIDGKKTIKEFEEPGFGYEYEAKEVSACILNKKTESNILPLSTSLLLHTTLDDVRDKIGLKYDCD